MATHKEWKDRWAKRWVTNAKAEIEHQEKQIEELRAALKDAEPDEADYIETLIENHSEIVLQIKIRHSMWKQTANRRWGTNVADLD